MTTLQELIEMGVDELKSDVISSPEYVKELENRLHELADSLTPVYTYEAIEMVLNNSSLWGVIPELGPAYGADVTVCNVATAVLYEEIYNQLSEWYWNNKEDIDEFANELEEKRGELKELQNLFLKDISGNNRIVVSMDNLKEEIENIEEEINSL